ncbi:hypothetical protein [Crateriforma conspicua]|uniref:hypothetical protein n=1 Tax=Crateriforma conspicua TaxID=2527996 RepID=UPI0013FCFDB1|nr:hypothetical protein [Crateriforma conspicua]
MKTRFNSVDELYQAMGSLLGIDAEQVAKMCGPRQPLEPTFEELEAEPKEIERVCHCCQRSFLVSKRFADEVPPDSPWSFCDRCFDYASTGDLTLSEQQRFPVGPPPAEIEKRIRKLNSSSGRDRQR